MDTIHLSNEGMRFWVKVLGGDYLKRRKTTALLSVGDQTVVADDSYWDGGSKYFYCVINKNGKIIRRLKENPPIPFNNGIENDWENLTDDTAVVKFGYFVGKPATPQIFVKNREGWNF